jgi:serine/threonine protein kinase
MSYCLNPDCSQPQNPDVTFCQSCGTKLLLRERYRAVRQIGQGGFGKTFLAVDQDLPNKPACVIKQFSPQIQGASGLQKATELFEQEAVQLNVLGKHPQIPELLAHFEQDGRLYLVQEYVKGQDLAKELAQSGAFSEAKIQELLIGLLPILQYIHDNQIIHRDIKPENIIRRNDGKLFLVDFGAVKLLTGSALLGTGTVIGDPRYMPSEQVRGKADFTSDLYALGVSCLHLLTNVEPINLFDDSEDKWIWRDYLFSPVNQSLGMVLDKMIEKAIKRRHHSASAILLSLGVNFPSQVVNNSSVKPTSLRTNTIVSTVNSSTTPQTNTKVSLEPVKMGNKWGYQDRSGQIFTKTLFDAALSFSEGLAPVKVNGKWGFIDDTERFIIQLAFDEAWSFENEVARVKVNNKWGLINQAGQTIVEPEFDEITSFQEGIAKVKVNSKWGLINQAGQTISESKFDEIGDFNEGLAKVAISKYPLRKYGFIDTTGAIIIDIQFDAASDFQHGIAKIGIGSYKFDDTGKLQSFTGSYGFIDKTGKIVVKPEFDSIGEFDHEHYNGFAKIEVNGKYGFIDKTCQIVLQPKFDSIGEFHREHYNEFAKIQINGKYGFIDKTCKIVLQPEFDSISKLYRSLDSISKLYWEFAQVQLHKKYGLIDEACQIFLKPEFDSISCVFENGFARVKLNGKYGLIDKKGQIVLKPEFDYIEGFEDWLYSKPKQFLKDGFAKVKFNGKYGFIDKKCQFVLKPEFDAIGDFKDGLAKVVVNRKYGLIDKTYKIVLKPEFDSIHESKNGFARIGLGEKFGFIDGQGKVAIVPKFIEAEDFSGGVAKVLVKGLFGEKWRTIDNKGKFVD